MARKHQLRKQRTGTVINLSSRKQETELGRALRAVEKNLHGKFGAVTLRHDRTWKIGDIVARLRRDFPDVEFHHCHQKSFIKPDGGILSIVDIRGTPYPILITEIKNQGTNDLRRKEGKPKQAKGNAIERLGKNVIGFRAAMRRECILPFVCFGDGCDFAEGSSILDRISTIAMFGRLNKLQLINAGPSGYFNRGSFYFREKRWTAREMAEIMSEIATRSIQYYFSAYGEHRFTTSAPGTK